MGFIDRLRARKAEKETEHIETPETEPKGDTEAIETEKQQNKQAAEQMEEVFRDLKDLETVYKDPIDEDVSEIFAEIRRDLIKLERIIIRSGRNGRT